jgi:hypothetical protein
MTYLKEPWPPQGRIKWSQHDVATVRHVLCLHVERNTYCEISMHLSHNVFNCLIIQQAYSSFYAGNCWRIHSLLEPSVPFKSKIKVTVYSSRARKIERHPICGLDCGLKWAPFRAKRSVKESINTARRMSVTDTQWLDLVLIISLPLCSLVLCYWRVARMMSVAQRQNF